MTANRWFYRRSPRAGPAMRLFCFPFAGGSANTFYEWDNYLPHNIEVIGVELPGRGLRFDETPFKRIGPLVDALEGPISTLADVPVLLFGHSMGALIAFEIARRLQDKTNMAAPTALLISAQKPPMLIQEKGAPSKLPQRQLIEHLRALNGMPAEVLQNRELLELLIPAIRADFELCENYRYAGGPRLTCPITAFCGTLDQGATAPVVNGWKDLTTSGFRLLELQGDHFFLNSMRRHLLQLLKSEILRIRGTAA